MTVTRDRRTWALVAVAAGAALVLAAMGLPLLREDIEVEGAAVLDRSPDHLTVRCLSPEVVLTLDGFSGRLTLTNCFPNSTLYGVDGPVDRDGTNITCVLDGEEGDVRLSAVAEKPFKFAVIGDSHGQNALLEEALRQAAGCGFVIHCGDATPSGKAAEFDDFEAALRTAAVPVMMTPGNHDVKLDRGEEYVSRFGPAAYSFDFAGTRFAFVDSSDQVVSDDELDWLRETYEGAETKVLVTHMPSYDPFGDNHTLDEASCERMNRFLLEEAIDLVLSGHIHAFNHTRMNETDMIITGGGGGILVDGVHHMVIVTADRSGFSYEKVDLDYTPQAGPAIRVVGKDGYALNLTYEELMLMDLTDGYSSYENFYGNIVGQGQYRGVPVRDLLEIVGGMVEGDLLTIASTDGYTQEFGFLNAYPDEACLSIQGEMIVSLEFDGVPAPDWPEGPRVAMLPDDGLYSNSDCELTSYEGQGFYVYESAGARWVKTVMTITVEAGQ